MTALPSTQPLDQGACCAVHKERPAIATCTRCGSFICEDDREVVFDAPYCGACAVLPEVDHLEATRRRYWGKRDAWAWLVGFGALLNLIGAIGYLGTHKPIPAVLTLVVSGLGISFFLGLRWARIAYFAAAFLLAGMSWLTLRGPGASGGQASGRLGGSVVMALVMIAIYLDTRNRLFFRIDVPREKLEKLWNTYRNNPIARAGFLLALLGLLVPGLALVSLPLSLVGLSRVAPTAHPPIGRKGQSIAGIVLSAIGLLGWGTILVFALRS